MLFIELKSINYDSKFSNKNQSLLCRFMNLKAVDEKVICNLLIDKIKFKIDVNQEFYFILSIKFKFCICLKKSFKVEVFYNTIF